MRKFLYFLLLILFSFIFVGCKDDTSEYDELITDELSVEMNQTVISWNAISNAEGYVILNGTEKLFDTTLTTIDLNTLIDTSSKLQITIYAYNNVSTSNYETIDYDPFGSTSLVDNEYYAGISFSLRGLDLKNSLRNLITTTHTKMTTYKEIRYLFIKTDADPQNTDNIILFYSGLSVDGQWDGGESYNREHVWPQSNGWFTESKAGSDLHHIRPTDPSINSIRNNRKYGNVENGVQAICSAKNNRYRSGCYYLDDYFEPRDEVKGDCARIIFYLLVRYSEADSYAISKVAQSMDVLLTWNKIDPVDDKEKNRNEEVFKIQGNRNPFIDDNKVADYIWG